MKDTTILARVLASAQAFKELYDADGVKVYYLKEDNYSIKIIKDNKVVKRYRRGRSGSF